MNAFAIPHTYIISFSSSWPSVFIAIHTHLMRPKLSIKNNYMNIVYSWVGILVWRLASTPVRGWVRTSWSTISMPASTSTTANTSMKMFSNVLRNEPLVGAQLKERKKEKKSFKTCSKNEKQVETVCARSFVHVVVVNFAANIWNDTVFETGTWVR